MVRTFMPEAKTIKNEEPISLAYLTCSLCGITGSGVIRKMVYVGGSGNTVVIQCKNETECWERWDKQNGVGIKGLSNV
jgi:hypothetical protein